jgi:hypothetical protein
MSNRTATVAALVAQVRSHAASCPGTEWDNLPTTDASVAELVGTGRKLNRVLEGVGQKLRVVRSGTPFEVAAKMSFQELVAAETVSSVAPVVVAEAAGSLG